MSLDLVSVYVGSSAVLLVVLIGLTTYLSVQVSNLKKLHRKDKRVPSGDKE